MMDLVFSAYSFYGDWDLVWLPLCILAVITSIILHTLILMMARSFKIREIERYAQSEMLQAGATALFAIFLVLMINSALELSQQAISGELKCGEDNIRIAMDDSESAMSEAFDGIRCNVQQKALEISEIQEFLNQDAGVRTDFYSLTMKVGIFGITVFQGDWSEDIFSRSETYRISNNLATTMLIALNAQGFLLLYIKNNMLTIFLPVGLLLRSFHFTRSAGALFIAIAIGFYFIFPIVYLLLDPGFVPIPLEPAESPIEPPNFCYPTMASTATMVSSLEATGFSSTSLLQLDSIEQNLVQSYTSLLLHPVIALFLTLAFVRYLMTLLQGDTFELMKMVSKLI